MLVDAVAGLQAGNKEPASKYLTFVAEHRGRAVATEAKARLLRFAKSRSFANCARWIDNGYQPVKEKR